jgi:acyl-CoA synthetase (NDP forming)
VTPAQRANLLRLLQPRHVAAIGGRDAETVARECARIGFAGAFWPVNPKRAEIGGHRCYPAVEDLPEAPDAVFLAIPREPAIDTVGRLRAMGAGGVVCYTAGFAETGETEAERRLLAAAGEMALVGPNCYGVINYVHRVALWPFAHGGFCPGWGAAIVTQSGMLSSDLTMSQRSAPLACMVSAGNQSALHLEDFVALLCERPEVRAIGLHIEGLKSVAGFEQAALAALARGVPIVALKTGTSAIGAELTVSHTGSLSGTNELYQALFERLGIIQVDSPARLLETVKLLAVAGVPRGTRIAGFTCSGGGATMLADHGERIGLAFPRPAPATAATLRGLLPHTATVSNPLDYTTPIWGVPERTRPVFEALLADGFDAAVILQDFPAPGLDESRPFYLADSDSFVAATAAAGVPAAVCSTLPENMDQATREHLVAQGVAPMQGLHECLDAIAGAARYGNRRAALSAAPPAPLHRPEPADGATAALDEAAGKAVLAGLGVPVPPGRVVAGAEAPAAAAALGTPVALKMLGERLLHKSEAGAVQLGLADAAAVAAAVERMRRDVAAHDPAAVTDRFLLERMVGPPVAELMVSVRRDREFGFAMTLASGGVLVELVGDAVTLLLPAGRAEIAAALDRLKVARLIAGFRGRPPADRGRLLDLLERIAAAAPAAGVAELEINPLLLLPDGACAVDVLLRRAAPAIA